MASLRKKPNSKFWYACFKAPDGRHLQRSTKTTDKKLAKKLADDFERASGLRTTELQARRVLSDLHQMITGEDISFPTVRGYFAEWLTSKNGSIAPSTQQAYVAVVSEFIEFLGARADAEIVYITPKDIVSFRDHVAKHLSPRTANLKLKILRVGFQQAWRDGVIADNPAAKAPVLKVEVGDESDRRAFTIEELQKLLKVAEGEWEGLILFGLYTGQRLGDLARLKWDSIVLETNTIKFTTRKTRRRQILPIAPALRKWIEGQTQRKNGQPVFQKSCATVERAGKVSTLSRQFSELMADAGFAPKQSHQKRVDREGRDAKRSYSNLTFHSLRHTATSLMKNAGVSPAIVQEFVGHDSKMISQNYTHIELSALQQAANALPEILPGRAT